MWVIHKIRLHTHVGRLVVPVRPTAHHLGVGFVVRLNIELFTVRSVHRAAHHNKSGASGKPAAGVNNVKANQSNATVSQLKPEINPVPI